MDITKIKNRKHYNLIILDILKDVVEKYHSMRFVQLLIASDIITYECIPSEPMERFIIKDEYYLESYDVLMRMMSKLERIDKDLYEKYKEKLQ